MDRPATLPDPYEPVADALIADCGGDAREAVIALLGEREYLVGRIEALEGAISWGYVRVRKPQRDGGDNETMAGSRRRF